MSLAGRGRAHGAITVVNAIPSGRGAAIGLDLHTTAEVELERGEGPLEVLIEGDPGEAPGLAQAVLAVLAEHAGHPLSGVVRTRGTIPIARGLKSSSVAANAMVLAVADALSLTLTPDQVLALAVKAARRAGVTATGALDDAAASLLGGLVVTDNARDRVVKRKPLGAVHPVLLLVPGSKRYTGQAVRALAPVEPLSVRLLDRLPDDWPYALTLNGLAVAAVLDEPLEPVHRALGAGALAAGLSGTGPAVAAVCTEESLGAVRAAWTGLGHDLIEAATTDEGASA